MRPDGGPIDTSGRAMPEWARLQHAYGSAEDVPRLLDAAENSPTESDEAWTELWSRLCHQGTVYPASFAALPVLADMAARAGDGGYVPALHLAAAIVASDDGPPERFEARATFSAEVQSMRGIAERCLGLAEDDTEFVFGLAALMAFEDGGPWQRDLTCLPDCELSLECPECGEEVTIVFEEPPFLLEGPTDASHLPTAVIARQPPAGSVEDRLIELTRQHGRDALIEPLLTLFGDATCPSCGAAFALPSALY